MPLLLNLLPARFLLTLREWFDYKISHCVISTTAHHIGKVSHSRFNIICWDRVVTCDAKFERFLLLQYVYNKKHISDATGCDCLPTGDAEFQTLNFFETQ